MFKLSPLYTTAQKMGALLDEHGGWHVAQRFGGVEGEEAAARDRVALADLSYMGKLLVEGQETAALLEAVWGVPPLDVSRGVMAGPGTVYQLRNDRAFIGTLPGDESAAMAALSEQVAKLKLFLTVTHMTQAWSELLLIGPLSAEVLSRLCGLDFHTDRFRNLTARQSSVAKTSQLIIRHDRGGIPAYSLIGGRSLAAYLWQTILEAGRDLEIRPIGLQTLTALEK
jgi:glycine cleavage system aminomethyltransferase T